MEYYDLGAHGRPVTTDSAEAQLWFDRGLVWTYAFHHEEAVNCFEKAAAADPNCAMAHWGIAYALGPNYNKPWGWMQPTRHAYGALLLEQGCGNKEGEARIVARQLRIAAALADVPVEASCFCRLDTAGPDCCGLASSTRRRKRAVACGTRASSSRTPMASAREPGR
jgi:tetratricopeptide (TPR) repeat protein